MMCLKLFYNTEAQEEPVNFNALLNEFDNDTQFVKTLTRTFIVSCRGFSKDIKSGLKSRDYVKVSEVAHALKGASGNLRCCSLYRAASDLELYTKVGQDERKSKRKANLVLKEIQRVVESITSYYYA